MKRIQETMVGSISIELKNIFKCCYPIQSQSSQKAVKKLQLSPKVSRQTRRLNVLKQQTYEASKMMMYNGANEITPSMDIKRLHLYTHLIEKYTFTTIFFQMLYKFF